MKILYLTSSEEDYLADSLLIGLRALLGENCIDYPRRDILYNNCPKESSDSLRGFGFTLYNKFLEEISIDRFHIEQKVKEQYFDLVIFSDIWRQWGFYLQMKSFLDYDATIFIDTADTPQVYPFAGRWIRDLEFLFLSKITKKSLYFKREYTESSRFNWWHRLFPKSILKKLSNSLHLRKISFSIPEEKIINYLPQKEKLFTKHIVDPEVCKKVPGSYEEYAFSNENEYYEDIRKSKFGITTKRAGWDALRHYEIAANATVPCFLDLNLKPKTCAPHGLNSSNCIIYSNYFDLMNKIDNMSEFEYALYQSNAIKWVRENSSRSRAIKLLKETDQWKKFLAFRN